MGRNDYTKTKDLFFDFCISIYMERQKRQGIKKAAFAAAAPPPRSRLTKAHASDTRPFFPSKNPLEALDGWMRDDIFMYIYTIAGGL